MGIVFPLVLLAATAIADPVASFPVVFEGVVLFADEPEWPVVVAIRRGPLGAGDAAVEIEVDGDPNTFRLEGKLRSGDWRITAGRRSVPEPGEYWPSFGPGFYVAPDGVVTCSDSCSGELRLTRVMSLTEPASLEVVTSPRPVLRWKPQEHAQKYTVTWFEHSPPDTIVKTEQNLETDDTAFHFADDLVPGRMVEWHVNALDAKGRSIAHANDYFYTVGAEPGAFRQRVAIPPGHGGYLGMVLNPVGQATVVIDVVPGTPAAEAGFESGDRLVRFGDREVVGLEVVEWIRDTEPGSRVEVVVERDGTRKTLAPMIGDRSKL